jgi:hypothetical protein
MKLAAMSSGDGDGGGGGGEDADADEEEEARVAFEQALVRRASLKQQPGGSGGSGGSGGGGGGGSAGGAGAGGGIGMPGMAVGGGLMAATLPGASRMIAAAQTNVSTVAELMSGWDASWYSLRF